jgi:hypothetical protein
LLLLGAIATAQEIPFKPWTKLLQRTVNTQFSSRLKLGSHQYVLTSHVPSTGPGLTPH